MTAVVNPAGVSETLPTTFTDGTAIPSGTITSVDYGYGAESKNYTEIVNDTAMKTVAGKVAYLVPADLALGTWFAPARTHTKDGAVADWGNEITITIAAKKPSPITDFSAA